MPIDFRKASVFWLLCQLLVTSCLEHSETLVNRGSQLDSYAFTWDLPDNIPLPVIPEENAMSEAKFELGRHLFYDERLSGNSTQSCGSCHQQDKAFSDGLPLAIGSTKEVHPRNSQALVNVAYNPTITWANPALLALEVQILLPLFGESPVEQGITDETLPEVMDRLRTEKHYETLFLNAFPSAEEYYTLDQIVQSIAVFVRGLISFNSAYDKFQSGDDDALSESALRGRDLFFSENLECFHCHGGYNFSDSVFDETMSIIDKPFHNTGLFNVDGNGSYPANNQGIFEITGNQQDKGKFRAVTLRNIALSAPYMHDGSMATLEEVIDFYSQGGRNITSGKHVGDGRFSPLKDGFVTGFDINDQEKQDLVNFLKSLTDTTFINNPKLSNPW